MRFDVCWFGLVRLGLVWFGLASLGLAWNGLAWRGWGLFGLVLCSVMRCDFMRFGAVRCDFYQPRAHAPPPLLRRPDTRVRLFVVQAQTDWRVMYQNLPQKASTYRGRILISREIRDELPLGKEEVSLGWVGLVWVGLGWVGLGWVRFGPIPFGAVSLS